MNSFASFPGKRVDIFFFDSNGNITQYDLKGENTMFDKNAPEMPWLDRDAILCNGFRNYLKNNLQTLINEKKVIFIHAAVRKELEARNDDESGELIAILDTLERNNLLKVMENKLEPYDSETQYLKAIIRNRTRQKIVFITNNRLLAEDVKMLNDLRSIQGNDVRFFTVTGSDNTDIIVKDKLVSGADYVFPALSANPSAVILYFYGTVGKTGHGNFFAVTLARLVY